MGKEKLIPIFAILVLVIGCLSSVYVYASTTTSTTIKINTTEYTMDQIFLLGEQKTLETNGEMFTGVVLDDLIIKSGVFHPENHEYTFIGADGYQKTVKWDNLINGLLTKERQVIFSDLPKAFRVKNIIVIEVE